MSLKYEPSSEPFHISAKYLFSTREVKLIMSTFRWCGCSRTPCMSPSARTSRILRLSTRCQTPHQSWREAIVKVNSTNLHGNWRQKVISTASHVVNCSNCRTRPLVEESRVDSSVDTQALRYKFVNFGVEKRTGSQNWWAQIDWGRGRLVERHASCQQGRTLKPSNPQTLNPRPPTLNPKLPP